MIQYIDCQNNTFFDQHELVVSSKLGDGFEAIISIHNTILGPAQGGTRIKEYVTKEEAINDVLRLSTSMSYKNCAASIPAGGGKAVIIKPKNKSIGRKHLKKYAELINSLDGQYITTEDVGMNQELLKIIQTYTKYAVGSKFQTYIYTADLLINSLKKIVKHKDSKDLSKFSITVQGVGKVGRRIVEKLLDLKCRHINICDINQKTLTELSELSDSINIVDNNIITGNTDILIPSAIGGIINKNNIDKLNYKIICGPANNILLYPKEDAKLIASRNILYIPDYLVNSGGIVAAYAEWEKLEEKDIYNIINKIPDKVIKLLDLTKDNNIQYLLDKECYNILRSKK